MRGATANAAVSYGSRRPDEPVSFAVFKSGQWYDVPMGSTFRPATPRHALPRPATPRHSTPRCAKSTCGQHTHCSETRADGQEPTTQSSHLIHHDTFPLVSTRAASIASCRSAMPCTNALRTETGPTQFSFNFLLLLKCAIFLMFQFCGRMLPVIYFGCVP